VSGSPNPYEEYLRVGELLALHSPRTGVPAENLFIAVHQVSELWLATLLREVQAARTRLSELDVGVAARHLRLAVRVFPQLSGTLDLLSTMRPTEFAAFRGALGTASAVQSRQYAEFVRACRGPGGSLWHAFDELATAAGGLTEVYRAEDGLTEVAELLVDLDDAFGDWMNRHWRLVRRQIGAKPGTAGRSADYLRIQLDKRLFPDLIGVRDTLPEAAEVPAR
jgi:tryptophan 2,3-dioxygenase